MSTDYQDLMARHPLPWKLHLKAVHFIVDVNGSQIIAEDILTLAGECERLQARVVELEAFVKHIGSGEAAAEANSNWVLDTLKVQARALLGGDK